MSESMNPYEIDAVQADAVTETTGEVAGEEVAAKCACKFPVLRAFLYGTVAVLGLSAAVAYAAPNVIEPFARMIPDSVIGGTQVTAKTGQSCCEMCPSGGAACQMAEAAEGSSMQTSFVPEQPDALPEDLMNLVESDQAAASGETAE